MLFSGTIWDEVEKLFCSRNFSVSLMKIINGDKDFGVFICHCLCQQISVSVSE